ncbi:MAG: hypothetical protein R3D56_03535 [Paracoccaceae bacterium]
MKRFILATALAVIAAPAAFAMSPADQLLSANDEAAIRAAVPGADLSNLTNAQRGALASALYSSDNNEVGRSVRSILGSSSADASRAASLSSYAPISDAGSKGSDNR